jgi:hypothetical protein
MYGNSKLFSFHHDILCIDICLHLDTWVLLNNIIKKKLVERAKVGHGSL